MKNTLVVPTLAIVLLLAGCSFSRDAAREQRAQKATRQIDQHLKEIQHDQALAHVVQASVY
jgi:protein involved in sex pheromone biosynthesis